MLRRQSDKRTWNGIEELIGILRKPSMRDLVSELEEDSHKDSALSAARKAKGSSIASSCAEMLEKSNIPNY